LLAAVALVGSLPGIARAQEPTRIRIGSPTAPAMSRESSSSDLVMTLSAGTELEVLGRESDWFWVVLPADGYGTSRAGWVHAGDVDGAVLRRAPKVKVKEDRAARAEQRAAAKAARAADKAAVRSARDEAAAAQRTAKANAKAAQIAAREAKKAEADERRMRKAAEELEKARRDYERLAGSARD
jgi:hypothetical protein